MDNIKVAIRVRPLITREENSQASINWKVDTHTITQVDAITGQPKKKCYNFDRVFDMTETTQDVYEEIAQPIVQSAMEGYDGTIFAYGQTSSGKTFTMHGNAEKPGIIPMTVQEIFATINEMPEHEFLLRGYYVELYNESLMDLLATDESKKLEIRETENVINGERMIRVSLTNQEEIVCTSAEEFLKLIQRGDARRHVGRTNMNEHSSRSHTIFCIIIESRRRKEKRQSADGSVKMSHLYLVDLAGSEKASDTNASGQRLKEACNINTSLFTLSSVISSLSRNDVHVPFRNSKLTRLLQSSLGGNSKTAIICAVTPAGIEQTHSTLQFAMNAKTIKNNATVNEILSDEALMQRLKNELQEYKSKIKKYEQGELKCEINDLHGRLEQVENEKLEAEREKNELIQKHEERLKYLSSILLVANTANEEVIPKKKKKLRRETWCPGAMRKVGTPITKALADGLDLQNLKPPASFQPLLMPSLNDSIASTASTRPAVEDLNDSAFKLPEELNDSAFKFKVPDFPSDSSSDESEHRRRKKRRRTVRFADTIEEESTSSQSDEEKKDLEKQLHETLDMCEKLMAEKSDLVKKLLEKEESCSLLEYDRKKYKDELEELEAFTRRESRSIQEQEDEFKEEIQELNKKIQEMSNSMEEVKQVQQLNYEEKSLADAEYVLMDLRKKLSEVTDQKKDLQEEMNKLKVDNRKLIQEKSDFDSHMHFEKERHQKMINDLKEQLQWAYDENASLKSSASSGTVINVNETVEATVNGDVDSNVTSKNVEEGTADKSQVAELEGIIEDKDQTIDDLQHQLETTAMIKELNAGLEGRFHLKELRRVEELKAELLEMNNKYVELQEEMQVKVSYLQEQPAKQRHYSVDESFIERNENTNKELEQLRNSLRVNEERHQAELESHSEEETLQQLTHEKRQHEETKRILAQLEVSSNEEHQQMSEDLEQLILAKNSTSSEPALSLQAELQGQEAVGVDMKNEELEEERQNHEQTIIKLTELEERFEEIQQKLSSTEQQLGTAQQQGEDKEWLEVEVGELKKQLSEGKEMYHGVQQARDEAVKRVEELSEELQHVKEELEGMTTSFKTAEERHQAELESRQREDAEKSQMEEETLQQLTHEKTQQETKRLLAQLEEEHQQMSEDQEQLIMAKNSTSSEPALSLQAELQGQEAGDVDKKNEELEEERQNHEQTIMKLTELEGRYEEIQQKLSNTEQQLGTAQQQCEDKEWLEVEVGELKKQLSEGKEIYHGVQQAKDEAEKKVQELLEKVEEMKTTLKTVEERHQAELESRLGENNEKNQSVEETLQQLTHEKTQHEETKRILAQLEEEHQQMSEDLEQLIMAKNSTSSEPALSLQTELQGQGTGGVDKKNEELEEEKQNHEQTIMKLTELEERFEDIQQKLISAEQMCKDKESLEVELKKQLSEEKKMYHGVEQARDEAEKKVAEISEELLHVSQQLEEMKTTLRTVEEKHQAELESRQREDAEKSQVEEETLQQLTHEKTQHEETKRILAQLEERLEDIQQKLISTEQQLGTAQQQLGAAQQQCEDKEWLEVENGELKKQLSEGKEMYHGVQQAKDEAEKEMSEELEHVSQELEEMKTTLRIVEEKHQAELERHQREDFEKSQVEEETLQQLTREKTQHEETKRILAQLEIRFVDLQQKLFNTEQQLGTAQQQCEDKERLEVEVGELKKQLSEGKEMYHGVQQARDEAEKKIAEMSEELEHVREELEGMRSTLRTAEERHQAELESRQRQDAEKSRAEEETFQQLTHEKTQHEETKRILVQLEGRLVDLQQKLFSTEQQLGTAQQQGEDKEWLEVEVGELKKQLSEGKEMYHGVQQARDEAEKKIAEMSEELEHVSQELEEMKTTLCKIEEEKKKVEEKYQAEKERFNREEEFLQGCCTAADDELDQEREDHKETKRKLQELQEKNEQLATQEVERLGRYEEIQQKLSNTEQQLGTAQQQCEDKEWLEVEVGELKKQLSEGKEMYHEVQQAKDEAEKKVQELLEKVEEMKTTLKTEERHQAELESRLGENNEKNQSVEETLQQLTHEKTQHEETKRILAQLEEEHQQMSEDLEQLIMAKNSTSSEPALSLQTELQGQGTGGVDKKNEELEEEKQNHEQTIMKLTELEERFEDIQQKLISAEQMCKDKESLEVEVVELKKQLSEGKEMYHGVEQARDEAEKKVAEISEELLHVSQQLEEMKTTLRTVEEKHQAELERHQREDAEKSQVEEEILQQLTCEKTQHEETKRILSQLEERLEDIQQKLISTEQQLGTAQQQLGAAQQQCEDKEWLEVENGELKKQLSEGKEMYHGVQQAKDEAEKKIAEMSEELEHVSQELEEMKTTLRIVEEKHQAELERHQREDAEKSQVEEETLQQLTREKTQHEETKRILAQLEIRFVDLQQKLFNTEQQLGTAQQQCEDKERLEVEVGELKKQLSEGKEMYHGVQQARDEAEKKIAEMSEELEHVREELEGMRSTLRTAKERHQAELESRQRQDAEKSRAEEETFQQLTHEKTQHEETKRILAQLEGRLVEDLQQKLFSTEQQLGTAQQQGEDKEWLEVEVGELKKQLSEGKEMYHGVQQARDEAEKKIAEMSEELEHVSQELEEMKTTLCKIEEEKKKVEEKYQAEKERFNREEEFLQGCCTAADDELDQEREDHKETKRKLQELQEKNEQLATQEVERLKTTLCKLEEEKKKVEKKYQAEKERFNREEEFLQGCCTAADDELDQEREDHKETKRKLQELQELQQKPGNEELEKQVNTLKMEVAGLTYERDKAQEKVEEKIAIIEKEAGQYMTTITELQQETKDLKKKLETAQSERIDSKPATVGAAAAANYAISASKVVLDCELYELKAKNRQLTTANKIIEKENHSQGIRLAAFENKLREVECEVHHFKKQAKIYYYKYKQTQQIPHRNEVLERALHDVNETPGSERSPVRRLHHQEQQQRGEPRWRSTKPNPHMEARITEMQAEHAAATAAEAAAAARPSASQQPAQPAREMTREEKLASWPSFGADEEEDKPAQCKQS